MWIDVIHQRIDGGLVDLESRVGSDVRFAPFALLGDVALAQVANDRIADFFESLQARRATLVKPDDVIGARPLDRLRHRADGVQRKHRLRVFRRHAPTP